MAKYKTITLPITYVSKNGAASTPIVYDQNYAVVSGETVFFHHDAGTPLKFPTAMADELLERYRDAGAVEVEGDGFDVIGRAQPPAAKSPAPLLDSPSA